ERIAPNGDRVDDTASIAYTLNRPATVSIYLLDAGNKRLPIRTEQARPAGSYEATFDGTIADSGTGTARTVVPADEYIWVVEAVDAAGNREDRQGRLTVADPDTIPPALTDVVAMPQEISPYDPSLSDKTQISYRLSEPATVTLYVEEPGGRRTRLAYPVQEQPGEHSHTWDGLVRDAIPAPGSYRYVVQVKDVAGNVVEGAAPVTISGTEEPDAAIVSVAFSPQKVTNGDLVKVAITVRNTGDVTLRTHGPDPGYTYALKGNFATVENGRYDDQARMWRVAVGWDGPLGNEGAGYPFRWGFGKDLAPGEETTVEGYIRISGDYTRLRFYAGLVYENVKYRVDHVGQQVIEVGY
ncbi:MAG: hypothetical protein M0Z94_18110, partial [Dehalococcoidales bacterium]|nr:hypothetical protein [Dehalococcoidales bacterium]